MLLKDFIIAIGLTLVFSIGVGVLFVRTVLEMLDIVVNGENEPQRRYASHHAHGGRAGPNRTDDPGA